MFTSHHCDIKERFDRLYNSTSELVDMSDRDLSGLGNGLRLRRHKAEAVANTAIHEARTDWRRYIGPMDTFADANPYDGNFVALVLPFTRLDRVEISAYFMEYAFLYDDICESANQKLAMDPTGDGLILEHADSVAGAKQMQAKIILGLFDIDQACGQRIVEKWKLGMSVTRLMKRERKTFKSLEEYLPYRSLDTGAPFVEAIMLFGMGIQLTEDDDATLKEVVAPAYAALGLANDYFSFDREYAEHIDQKDTDGLVQEPMTNSVWLCMGWHSLSIEDAKTIVRDETIRQEQEFAARKAAFTSCSQCTDKIKQCLDGLSQMIIGNIVWSLRCPRYHPLLRYDANAGVENQLLALSQPTFNDAQAACLRSTCTTPPLPDCTATPGGIDSPMDASPSTPQETSTTDNTESATSEKAILSFHSALHSRAVLTDEVVRAPFEWCASAPSKQFRASLIDALNIWTGVPLVSLNIIKSIGSQLHNASLLLDDIEDRSPLRRGRPAAYTVFGVAETINSANFAILEATSQAQNLNRQSSLVFHERMQQLYIGQSYDIRWARHKTCPSLEEYTAMIDGKTGGLLHLIVGLMLSNATNPLPSCQTSKLEELITLIGRLFQIRDDYQNLNSLEYESAKGFGEDLDEGKYSYPMVVALSLESRSKRLIESILAGCEPSVGLSRAMKLVVRDEMEACGAFAATVQAINELDAEILRRIDAIEVALQEKSWALRWLIKSLGIQ